VTATTGETSGLGHEAGPGASGSPAGAGDLAGSSVGPAADHPSGEAGGTPDAEPAAPGLPQAPYGSWASPISAAQVAQLQVNLVRSHAAGVGQPLPRDAVRGMMLLRAAVLATGRSGARPLCCERLCELLNAGVHPVIPTRGSVGASGDLAPLAHLALGMIGEGLAEYRGEIMPAAKANYFDFCQTGFVISIVQTGPPW